MYNRTKDQLKIYDKVKSILLESSKPSIEIIKLIESKEFDNAPFNMIVELKKIEQNKTFHKEGNVFNHTMLVIDKASILREKSENKVVFMLSALLHDLGKLTSTRLSKHGRITSFSHDKASSKLVFDFLDGFESEDVIKRVSNLTLYHMQSLYYQRNVSLFNLKGIWDNVVVDELILLNIADRTGRLGVNEEKEIEQLKKFKNYLEQNKK